MTKINKTNVRNKNYKKQAKTLFGPIGPIGPIETFFLNFFWKIFCVIIGFTGYCTKIVPLIILKKSFNCAKY